MLNGRDLLRIAIAGAIGPCLFAISLTLGRLLFSDEPDVALVAKVNQKVDNVLPGYRVVGYKPDASSPCAIIEDLNIFVVAKEDENGVITKDQIKVGLACVNSDGTNVISVHVDK